MAFEEFKIKYEYLIGTYEQKREVVKRFDLMDDIFFSVVMNDRDACEYFLSTLLGKPIKVIENKTQYSLRNIENHSVVLDALIEDADHKLYNVEIQINDQKDLPRRMRYYHTAIDWSYLEKGKDYNDLPELYMIFISKFDPFGENKNHYEVKQYVGSTEYDDGIRLLYFNTEADDGTGPSKLLRYLKKSDENNNEFGALSKAVNFYKVRNEGVETMCDAVRELVQEYRLESFNEGKLEGLNEGRLEGLNEGKIEGMVESVRNMLKKGMPLETALNFTGLDRETYEKHSDSTNS